MEKFANLFTLAVVGRGCWPQRALFARAAWDPGAAAGRGRVMAPLAGGHVREGSAVGATGLRIATYAWDAPAAARALSASNEKGGDNRGVAGAAGGNASDAGGSGKVRASASASARTRNALVAALLWLTPPSDRARAQPRAFVLALHGHAVHARYEFIPASKRGGPHDDYSESIIARLNAEGMSVHAYDQQSFGLSESRVPGKLALFCTHVPRTFSPRSLRTYVYRARTRTEHRVQGCTTHACACARERIAPAPALTRADARAPTPAPTMPSCGQGFKGRGFVKRFDDLVDDCVVIAEKLRAEADALGVPLYLLACSMGGCVGVRTMQRRPKLFDGAVLVAPMLSLEQAKRQPANAVLLPVVGLLSRVWPTLRCIRAHTRAAFARVARATAPSSRRCCRTRAP